MNTLKLSQFMNHWSHCNYSHYKSTFAQIGRKQLNRNERYKISTWYLKWRNACYQRSWNKQGVNTHQFMKGVLVSWKKQCPSNDFLLLHINPKAGDYLVADTTTKNSQAPQRKNKQKKNKPKQTTKKPKNKESRNNAQEEEY